MSAEPLLQATGKVYALYKVNAGSRLGAGSDSCRPFVKLASWHCLASLLLGWLAGRPPPLPVACWQASSLTGEQDNFRLAGHTHGFAAASKTCVRSGFVGSGRTASGAHDKQSKPFERSLLCSRWLLQMRAHRKPAGLERVSEEAVK